MPSLPVAFVGFCCSRSFRTFAIDPLLALGVGEDELGGWDLPRSWRKHFKLPQLSTEAVPIFFVSPSTG